MLMLPIAIASMIEGDDKTFMADLYRKNYRLMRAVALRYIREPALADEILSDSCLSLMRHIGMLRDMDECSLHKYIAVTVKNTAFNTLVRLRTARGYFIQPDEDTLRDIPSGANTEEKILLREELETVARAILRLPEKERIILRMKTETQMNDAAIADATGLSESSVRKYVSRARSKLKALVYGEEQDER